MTLLLHRIDDRLIHGQVVVGWGQPLDLAFIVLVDDTVASSEWEQELYRMGVPPEMEVHFHDVKSAAAALSGYQLDSRRGLLLTGDVSTMLRLAEMSRGITTVNVGGIHHRGDRTQRLRYVFLAPDEERQLTQLAERGVTVTAQDVLGARPIPLDELLRMTGDG